MVHSEMTPGRPLIWARIHGTGCREYALTQGGASVGSLRWQKGWGSLALGATAHGAWSFKRVGFFNIRISARALGTEIEVAAFHPNMLGGGRIETRDGRRWQLEARGFFNRTFELADGAGCPVFTLRASGDGGEIVLGSARSDEQTAGLLMLLVWHAALLADDDAAATVAATACLS
jgi:hypothetical protein